MTSGLIWVTSLLLVFENLTSLRVHSDLVHSAAALDVEGVAKTAAASLTLQFFVRNRSRLCFERNGASIFDANLCSLCQFLARVSEQITWHREYQSDERQTEGNGSKSHHSRSPF